VLPISLNLDPFSLLAGVTVTALVTLLVALLLRQRHLREHTALSLRLDQALAAIRRRESEMERIREERNRLRRELGEMAVDRAGLRRELKGCQAQLQDRESLLEELRRQVAQQFSHLALQIFEEQGQRFDREQRQGLQNLLEPVREQVTAFREKVEQVFAQESREHAALIREIEILRRHGQRLGKEAEHLARALQGDTRVQGTWGEMVLERVLEQAGLRQDQEFILQSTRQNADGDSRRPDVIVRLPDERQVIIDAKVSLTHWAASLKEKDPAARKKLLHQHLRSLKKHIRNLSARQYHQLNGLSSLDFVLLFLPAEGALQAALEQEPDLPALASRRKVILCSPASLLAILRVIHHLWRMDEQARNGLAIAKEAGNLYDKFVVFAEAFEETGQRIEQSRKAWQLARKRLVHGRGNLVNRLESLRRLGVDPDRVLPDSLTGPEETAEKSHP